MSEHQKIYDEDTALLSSEGPLVDGEKTGTWTYFHKNGQASGQGHLERGRGEGAWRYWDEQGRLSCLAQFRDDQRHGRWVWYNTANGALRQELDYVAGQKHGEERLYSWDLGRHVATHHWREDQRHGPFWERNNDGVITREGSYEDGQLEGVLKALDDKGKLKSYPFARGVLQLPDKRRESLAKQIAAKKSSYSKLGILEKVMPRPGSAHRLLWDLVATGVIDAGADEDLWSLLSEHLEGVRPAEGVVLLKSIKKIKKDSGYLPSWPLSLDRITTTLYAADRAPFEEARASLSKPVAEGLKLVQRRFGHLSRADFDVRQMAARFASLTIEGYGVGQGASDGQTVLWPERGGLTPLKLGEASFKPSPPSETLYEFLALFTTRAAWDQAVLEVALKKQWNIPPWRAADAWRTADCGEQLRHLIAKADSPRVQLYALLDAFRPADDPEDWMKIADRLAEEFSNRSDADRLACAAILRAHAQGRAVPESWLRHFRFSGYEYGYGSGYGEMFTGVEQVAAVLALFPRATVRGLIHASLTREYPDENCAPFLAELVDDALWGLLERNLSATVGQYDLVLSNRLLLGRSLGRAAGYEEALLNRLAQTAARATDRRLADLWLWCGVHVLAGWLKRGGLPDPRWDGLIRFTLVSHKDDYDFTHYVGPLLAEVLAALPRARAEAVWLAALNPSARFAARPMVALAEVASPATLAAAGAFLAKTQDNLPMPYQNHVEIALRKLSPDQAAAVVRGYVAAAEEIGPAAGWFRNALGSERADALLAEGGAKAGSRTPAEALQRLAQRYLHAWPKGSVDTIYVLSAVEAAPTGIGRVGGLPPALPEGGWPRRRGESPMTHLFTLDLALLPALAEQLGGAAALSLYVEDPSDNEAYDAYNSQVRVVPLRADDLARGEPDVSAFDDLELREARALQVEAVEVPLAAFAPSQDSDSDQALALRELHSAIYRLHARAGGEPIWLQSESDGGAFLMQFDEGFVDINLGDMGVFYVFDDTGYWQCH